VGIYSSFREAEFSPGRELDEYQKVNISNRKLIARNIRLGRNDLIDLF